MNRLNRVATFYTHDIDGKKWLKTPEFLELLQKLGVKIPIASDFDVTLPNGKRVSCRVDGSATPVASPVKPAKAPKAPRPVKPTTTTLSGLKDEQKAMRAWKAAGGNLDTRPATPLTDARNAEAQREREGRQARLTALAAEKSAPVKKAAPQVTPIGKNGRERKVIEDERRAESVSRSKRPAAEKAAAEARISELRATV